MEDENGHVKKYRKTFNNAHEKEYIRNEIEKIKSGGLTMKDLEVMSKDANESGNMRHMAKEALKDKKAKIQELEMKLK